MPRASRSRTKKRKIRAAFYESSEDDNAWTIGTETLANNIMHQAAGLSWVFNEMYKDNKKISNRSTMLTGFLSAIMGTASLIILVLQTSETIGNIVGLIVSCVIGLIATLNSIWEIEEKIKSATISSERCNNIYNDIAIEFSKPRHHRVNAHEFNTKKLTQLSAIKESSPNYSRYIPRYERGGHHLAASTSIEWDDITGEVERIAMETQSSSGSDHTAVDITTSEV